MFRTICSALLVAAALLGMTLNPAIAQEEEEEELQALTFPDALKGQFQAMLRAEKAHKQAKLQLLMNTQQFLGVANGYLQNASEPEREMLGRVLMMVVGERSHPGEGGPAGQKGVLPVPPPMPRGGTPAGPPRRGPSVRSGPPSQPQAGPNVQRGGTAPRALMTLDLNAIILQIPKKEGQIQQQIQHLQQGLQNYPGDEWIPGAQWIPGSEWMPGEQR